MKRSVQKLLRVIMVASILLLWSSGVRPGVAQSDDRAEITAPAAGQSLFGSVTITGTARAANFVNYRLEYDDLRDPDPQWFLVQEIVTQQVTDGVLGVWNTNMVPDGTYRLRLRIDRAEEEPLEAVVSNLRVLNSEPTPLPTIASGPVVPTDPAPTPGPTPTSLIEQPPSSSTEFSDATDSQTIIDEDSRMATADTEESSPTRINLDRVEDALCNGVLITLGIFVVVLSYGGLRRIGRTHR